MRSLFAVAAPNELIRYEGREIAFYFRPVSFERIRKSAIEIHKSRFAKQEHIQSENYRNSRSAKRNLMYEWNICNLKVISNLYGVLLMEFLRRA